MSACIPYDGCIDARGYGAKYLSETGRSIGAHRLAYEAAFGPIPDGMVIDHTCHNVDLTCLGGPDCMHRRCVNPDHLEAVTDKVNILRSTLTLAGQNARKTHCKRGHEFTPENTYTWQQSGGRVARACRTCCINKAVVRNAMLREQAVVTAEREAS